MVPARRWRRARPSSCGCGCAGARRRRRRRARARTSTTCRRRAPRRGRRVLRRADPAERRRRRGARHAPGLRRDALEQAALPLRRRRAGSTATRPSRRRRRRAGPAATRAGATSTPSTSCRCPTSGSTRGSRPGTWRSTASPWPTSTRRSPSTSCCCSAASGSSTRTARCPPTSGTSATSTRRCRRGRRCEVFAIDGGRDLDFLEPRLRQAAGQLHVVGQPRGRRRLQPVRGRLPRASTTSARSTARTCPVGGRLEQSDATGWMAFYALTMAAIASILNRSGQRPADDLVAQVPRALRRRSAEAMDDLRACGTTTDGFFYDQLDHARRHRSCRSRSARWSASSRCSPRSSSTSG